MSGHTVSFTDKLNRVRVFTVPSLSGSDPGLGPPHRAACDRAIGHELRDPVGDHRQPPGRAGDPCQPTSGTRPRTRSPARSGRSPSSDTTFFTAAARSSFSCPRRRAQTTSTPGARSPARSGTPRDPDRGARLEGHDLYRFFHTGEDETLALRGVSLSVAPARSPPPRARRARANPRCWRAWRDSTSPTAGTCRWTVCGYHGDRRPSGRGSAPPRSACSSSSQPHRAPVGVRQRGARSADGRQADRFELARRAARALRDRRSRVAPPRRSCRAASWPEPGLPWRWPPIRR